MNSLIHAILTVDFGVHRFLGGFAGNWLLDRITNFEESNHLFKGGLFLAMYAYFWFRVGPNQEKNRRAILAILTGTLLTLVVSRTIADLAPFRLRPIHNLDLPQFAYSLPIARNLEDWSAFPSDTAAYFFALACGLAHLSRRYSIPVLLYTAIWICFPRLYLASHYLSDIVAGTVIGIVLVKICLKSEWLQQTVVSPTLRWMDAKPQVFYSIGFLIFFEMGVLFDDVRWAMRSLFHAVQTEQAHQLFRAIPPIFMYFGAAALLAIAVVYYALSRWHVILPNRVATVRSAYAALHSVHESSRRPPARL
jgi:undecaprenyl-diphosphatase